MADLKKQQARPAVKAGEKPQANKAKTTTFKETFALDKTNYI